MAVRGDEKDVGEVEKDLRPRSRAGRSISVRGPAAGAPSLELRAGRSTAVNLLATASWT